MWFKGGLGSGFVDRSSPGNAASKKEERERLSLLVGAGIIPAQQGVALVLSCSLTLNFFKWPLNSEQLQA